MENRHELTYIRPLVGAFVPGSGRGLAGGTNPLLVPDSRPAPHLPLRPEMRLEET